MTEERLEVVDFSHVTYFNEIAFMSQSPQMTKPDSIVALPFQNVVWLSIAVVAIIVLTGLKLVSHLPIDRIGTSLIAISLKQRKYFDSVFANIFILQFLYFL